MIGISGKKRHLPSGADLAEEGLRQVAIAAKNHLIKFERGRLFDDIYVHADNPAGTPRLTYVFFAPASRAEVIARCVILFDRVQGVLPIWQIDWAVLSAYRGDGVGKSIATKALGEFVNGFKGKLRTGFAVEAVVDEDNEASKAIARSLLGGEQVILNPKTQQNVLSFLKRFSA